ncbi:unnamed protein product [Vitrella brassicaformis CCMP3155]|uniref:C3H1-type domain-containing protein n=2 Tax=Vitrella brassicaformis TaxID=1169539 RepID=A0A0G4FSR5_VITBC|nr:unnamed protein product [Vitrella brassicaformis CCMP3155]|eukprot:CEM17332.1 unnamed protein product [Vitrella brassicaformis CCMP3155]
MYFLTADEARVIDAETSWLKGGIRHGFIHFRDPKPNAARKRSRSLPATRNGLVRDDSHFPRIVRTLFYSVAPLSSPPPFTSTSTLPRKQCVRQRGLYRMRSEDLMTVLAVRGKGGGGSRRGSMPPSLADAETAASTSSEGLGVGDDENHNHHRSNHSHDDVSVSEIASSERSWTASSLPPLPFTLSDLPSLITRRSRSSRGHDRDSWPWGGRSRRREMRLRGYSGSDSDAIVTSMWLEELEDDIGRFECPDYDELRVVNPGSAYHELGCCQPCVFYWTKGCRNGANCPFCHLYHPRRKDSKSKRRMRGSARPNLIAHGYSNETPPPPLPPTVPPPPVPPPPPAMPPPPPPTHRPHPLTHPHPLRLEPSIEPIEEEHDTETHAPSSSSSSVGGGCRTPPSTCHPSPMTASPALESDESFKQQHHHPASEREALPRTHSTPYHRPPPLHDAALMRAPDTPTAEPCSLNSVWEQHSKESAAADERQREREGARERERAARRVAAKGGADDGHGLSRAPLPSAAAVSVSCGAVTGTTSGSKRLAGLLPTLVQPRSLQPYIPSLFRKGGTGTTGAAHAHNATRQADHTA